MRKITRNFLIAGTGLAAAYGFMKAAANKKTEDESIDDGNPYINLAMHTKERDSKIREVGIYEGKVKPALDRLISFGSLVILSPLFGLISFAVYVDDPGSVFFTQKRIGKDKHYVQIHKFRSMRMDTPHDVPTHQLENPEQYITKVGRVLRKTSLDELPQIWDILRGRMSFIGPRPALWNQDDLVAERDQYGANDIMPGLTGLAQIKGRDELEISAKAKLDGEYAAVLQKGGVSAFGMDVKCFIGTVLSVLKHDGVVEGGTGVIRKIETPTAKETGFEDYGCYKKFDIDKSVCKRVLITGDGSYIGESFVSYCKEHYPNIKCDTIDLKDNAWKEKSFSGYDTVFHVAGIAHADVEKVSEAQQGQYYTVNTDLAIECCRKAKEDGVIQFIFMSSMLIYGGAEYIDEKTVPNPTNFYGNSKWLADKGVRAESAENFNVAVLRPPMIYGRGSKGNYQQLAKIARKVPIFPDYENKRSMLYIENLCEFVSQLSLSGEGGIYFPQNAEYTKTSSMVQEIGRIANRTVRISKILTLAVKISAMVPGKVRSLVNKAFGNSYYDQSISKYEWIDYQKYELSESIARTEGVSNVSKLTDEPLVSVITAAYNCEFTIAETIDSVLAQTYKNWEMIIVNDSSTDHTVSVVKKYAESDSRIKLVDLDRNLGAAGARNAAMRKSRGRYIAILDADDLWKPKKLEHQIAFMVQNGYAFTFTSYEIFHDKNDFVRTVFRAPKSVNYKQYLKNTIIGNLTVIMDKKQIPDVTIQSGHLEDVLTWMYYLKKGYTAFGLDENLASYRISAGSKSGNKLRNAKRYYECLQEQEISLPECIIDEFFYLLNAVKKRAFGKTIKYEEGGIG